MGFKVKANRYVEVCKKVLKRKTKYMNAWPYNIGLYDGTYLWGDCWCFNPKTIIWGEAIGEPICDHYKIGEAAARDRYLRGIAASGLPDTTGDAIMDQYCTQVSFAKMFNSKKAPCLLLINGQHMGAYIGEFTMNGKIYNACEFTPNAALGDGLCPSYVDASGKRMTHKNGYGLGYWDRAGYLTAFVDYSTPTPVKKSPFKDVATTDSKYKYIKACYDAKIINGYKDGTFKPKNKITRADVCIICNKLMKKYNIKGDKNMGKMPFTDVKETDAKYAHIKACYDAGLIKGYSDNTFRPNDFITREDVCVIFNRLMKKIHK